MKDTSPTLMLWIELRACHFTRDHDGLSAVATKAQSLNGDCVIIGGSPSCSARCSGSQARVCGS